MSGRPHWMRRADEVAAQCMGGAYNSPESLLTDEEKEDKRILERIDEQVFYCENCGYWWNTDERHVGDLCDDCHDAREDGLTDY